jgi:hypothetical protein
MSSSRNEPQSVLDAVTGLSPAGFETLVCDALAELTGVRVRRARSGDQGGRDGRAESDVGLMVECKRYVTGKLSDRELIGELYMARDNGCDLWVLAATNDVPDQTASQLQAAAATLGCVALLLDWPGGQAKPLLTLLSGAPQTVARHLGPAVARQIEEEAKAAPDAIERLRRSLDSPLLSLEALARSLARHLDSSLANAAELNRYYGARPPTTPRGGSAWAGYVERRKVTSELDDWAGQMSKRGTPLVLLGDEGVGKSLAALHWLHGRAKAGDIVISITPSSGIEADEPLALIAQVARKLFGGEAERWQKRLEMLFSRAHRASRHIILYFDGLNERVDNHLTELLKALQTQPFVGQVSVLMSCRPWPFAYRFARLASLTFPPKIVMVEIFDDRELGEALALHGRRLSEFSAEMHPLLARPRLLAMALRIEGRLRAAGEYTPVRLFWEDWRDRLEAGRKIIEEAQYRAALTFLARALDRLPGEALRIDHARLGSAIDHAQFGPSARQHEQTFSEIVDSGLARLGSDLKLQLDPDFAGMALGLELRFLLCEQHRQGTQTHAAIKDIGKSFLEPWGGADFGAVVARFAAWSCCELPDTPSAIRSAVLSLWLEEQNFGPAHIADLSAVIRRDSEAAFVAIDDVWFSRSKNAARALQRAFAPVLKPDHAEGSVRAQMIAKAQDWAGWIVAEDATSKLVKGYATEGRTEPFAVLGISFRLLYDRDATAADAVAFALDALTTGGIRDLAELIREIALSTSLVSTDLPAFDACLRALRRSQPEDGDLRRQLELDMRQWKFTSGDYAKAASDALAFLLDAAREGPDPEPNPEVVEHWAGVSPVFAARFSTDRYYHEQDQHLLIEGLLEPEALLTRDAIEKLKGFAYAQVIDAAHARRLLRPAARGANRPAKVVWLPNSARRPPVLDPAKARSLLKQALNDARNNDAIASLFALSDNRAFAERARLLAPTGREFMNGRFVAFARDESVLSPDWLVGLFGSEPAALSGCVRTLLTTEMASIDAHLQYQPGLLFGLTEASLRLDIPEAPHLWLLLASDWQDFVLLPDYRYWYFDMPFHARLSERTAPLLQTALDAADNEAMLMNVCLSAVRHDRIGWLRGTIAKDWESNAAWRRVRALVLAGMMGEDPQDWTPANESFAPAWIEDARVAAFRYARRYLRMHYWTSMIATQTDAARAEAAMNVLRADVDRRIFQIAGRLSQTSSRSSLFSVVFAAVQSQDAYRPGNGLLEHFLGITPHPWLGPPAFPDSPFK